MISKKHILILMILVLEAGFASSPLLGERWFLSHDTPSHIGRLFAVSYEMRQGDFYPRWLSQACFGKGLPVLNFYSPAFYLVVGWVHVVLGISLEIALKLVCFFLFVLGSWGMFLWLRKYLGPFGSLLAATIYMFTPYHFLDLYVRGALPEFAALALLPFLFHAIDLSFAPDQSRRGIIFTGIVTAAIILTHNLTAFMITPFALLYFAWKAISQEAPPGRICKAGTGPILGAGLSAFYWLPMVTEIGYLGQFGEATAKAFHYSKHFVYPRQWFSSFWGFGVSGRGSCDGMSFQIGAVLLAVAAFALPRLFSASREIQRFGRLLLTLGLFGLFLTTAFSSFLYTVIPSLQFIQFPWRFLGPSTLFFAAFTGLLAGHPLIDKSLWAKALLLGGIILSCIVLSASQRAVKENMPVDLDQEEEKSIKDKTIGVLGAKNEFLPKWAGSEPIGPEVSAPGLLPIWPDSQLSELAARGPARRFRVFSSHPSMIVVPSFYFPGWKATVDGIPVRVTAARGGLVTCQVPAGAHTVIFWFGSTWLRMVGWTIAILTLVFVGGFSLISLLPSPSRLANNF